MDGVDGDSSLAAAFVCSNTHAFLPNLCGENDSLGVLGDEGTDAATGVGILTVSVLDVSSVTSLCLPLEGRIGSVCAAASLSLSFLRERCFVELAVVRSLGLVVDVVEVFSAVDTSVDASNLCFF